MVHSGLSKNSVESSDKPQGGPIDDSKLFNFLSSLRREEAQRIKKPAFIVFSDATLKSMAQIRPTTLEQFRELSGVGDKKLAQYGDTWTKKIREFCNSNEIPLTDPNTDTSIK